MAEETSISPRIAQLQERLKKDPNSRLFLQLAEEYRGTGNAEMAAEICRAGLAKHPQYWAARVALARACVQLGKAKEAVRELKKVLKAVPDNILAGKLLAQIYEKVGKSSQALKTYQRLVPYDPGDEELLEKIADLEAQVSREQREAETPMIGESAELGGEATPELDVPAELDLPPAEEEPAALPPAEAPAALGEGTMIDDAPPELEGTAILDEPPELEGGGGAFTRPGGRMGAREPAQDLPPEMRGEVNRVSHELGEELEQAPADQSVPDTLDLTPSPDLLPKDIRTEKSAAPEAEAPPAPAEEPPAAEAAEPAAEEGVVSRTMAQLLYDQGHLDKAIETMERLVLMDQASKEDEEWLAHILAERGDRIGEKYEANAREGALRRELDVWRRCLSALDRESARR